MDKRDFNRLRVLAAISSPESSVWQTILIESAAICCSALDLWNAGGRLSLFEAATRIYCAIDKSYLPIDDLKTNYACSSHRLFPTSLSRRYRSNMDVHGKQDTGRPAIESLHTHFRRLSKHSLASIQPNEPGVAHPQTEWRRRGHPNPRQARHYRGIHEDSRHTCFEGFRRRTFQATVMEVKRVIWPQSIHLPFPFSPHGDALRPTGITICSKAALSWQRGESD